MFASPLTLTIAFSSASDVGGFGALALPGRKCSVFIHEINTVINKDAPLLKIVYMMHAATQECIRDCDDLSWRETVLNILSSEHFETEMFLSLKSTSRTHFTAM